CLGMLSEGPASSYDLKKEFESSFAHFFAAGFGSIYPALSALADDGLVSCETIPQDGKPDRKLYRITDPGRAALIAALDKPNPSHKIRSEFLATLCFSHLMSNEQIETVLRNRKLEIEEYLKLFDELEQCDSGEWTAGHRFVLGFGKTMIKTKLDYINRFGHTLLHEDEDEENTRQESAAG
ncbi:MAG: PadR family transcriptional regulator, partial [Pseudomonadota bacterium]